MSRTPLRSLLAIRFNGRGLIYSLGPFGLPGSLSRPPLEKHLPSPLTLSSLAFLIPREIRSPEPQGLFSARAWRFPILYE
jgi:hypothetical protein